MNQLNVPRSIFNVERSKSEAGIPDDSAIAAFRWLEEGRGDFLSQAEYQKLRKAVVEELARGPSAPLFTLLTFGTVGLLLLGLLLLGIIVLGHDAREYLLALASMGALAVWSYLFWSYLRGIRQQSRVSLDKRLAELEELRSQGLISREEYDYIRAGILISRQLAREE